MTGRLALGIALTACLCAQASAQEASPRRPVAVLEFRSGSPALGSIGERLAKILRDRTSLDVSDQTDARRRYGGDLEKAVAACAGAAPCIARIGRKLKVDEILLVGVADFGDVIVTLQRISAANGKVRARIAEALGSETAADAEALDGFLRRVMPKSDFLRYGTLRIRANVDGARVDVGGIRRGSTPVSPLRVAAPATYRIEVSKPGYIDFRASVAVPPDAEVQVRPVLERRGDNAWYEKWWVIALAGTVAAGAVTTAVIISFDEPTDVPVRVDDF